MPDLLRRRFRDKLQFRPHGSPRAPEPAGIAVPEDSLLVLGIESGPVPGAERINRRFAPEEALIRLTVALGSDVARRIRPLDPEERGRLLALCPYLPLHGCGSDGGVLDLLSPLGGERIDARVPTAAANGLMTAHLIEHVALDIAATAGGGIPRAGATCQHADQPDRFDVLLQCNDTGLGRAVALLAVAAVRDLGAPTDRTVTHTRSVSLLTDLVVAGRTHVVPEDVSDRRAWPLDETCRALEELVRLDFLEPIRAPLTFSTRGDLLFRRTPG
jgi:hypothetical protein